MDFRYMLFALLLVPFAGAQGIFEEPKADVLDAAMDHAMCRTEFTVGVLESHIEVLGADELEHNVAQLEDDVQELEHLAEEGEYRPFRYYVRDEWSPHMLDARQAVHDAREDAEITPEQRKELGADYMKFYAEFQECNSDSVTDFGNAKVRAYEALLERADARADELEDKGIDVSGLRMLIGDARDEVVEPLSDALEDAEDAHEVREALQSYCMFDGCPHGFNFHFAAKWHAEKLDQVLSHIESRASAAGLEDEWQEAKDYVDAAKDALERIGGSKYTEESREEVWGSLHEASDVIKGIIRELRSE